MTPQQNLKSLPVPYTLTISRVGTAANGNISYTGIGFKASVILFNYGIVGGGGCTGRAIWGNSANRGGYYILSEWSYPTSNIYVNDGSSNIIQGSLVSINNDGFTVSWTKSGSPTYTLLSYVVAIP